MRALFILIFNFQMGDFNFLRKFSIAFCNPMLYVLGCLACTAEKITENNSFDSMNAIEII